MRRAFLALALLIFAVPVRADTAPYYASPTGAGSGQCSIGAPCTLAYAQTVVRAAVTVGLTRPVTVYLRGGTYTLTSAMAFTSADSGTATNPISWCSYPRETAIVNGGQIITGWSLYSGNIYRANVGTSWNFRQLYVNGTHVQRARGTADPAGWARTSTGYTAPDSSMASWGNPTAIEIVNLGIWSMDRCKVVSIAGTAITMTSSCWTAQQAILANYYVGATPAWVENAYELMAPGYWYLDRTAGYLYYWPPSGSMTGSVVTAPVSGAILTITSASNIQFGTVANPLAFAYSNWTTDPDSALGYVGEQSGNYWSVYTSDLRTQSAAVTISASSNITFSGNRFSHMGSRVLLVRDSSSNVNITDNAFDDNAGGAVQLGTVAAADASTFVRENLVSFSRNRISAGNSFDYQDAGHVFAPCISNSTIANNEINGPGWVAISIGWGWSDVVYAANNSVVGNYVVNPCTGPTPLGLDGGGIYSVGNQSLSASYATGLYVTNNYVTGTYYPIALYTDQGTAWSTWTSNVAQGYWSGPFLHGGESQRIETTILAAAGAQPFGTPAQAVICGSGVPGSGPCATPTLWPTWCNGVGATWRRPQIGL